MRRKLAFLLIVCILFSGLNIFKRDVDAAEYEAIPSGAVQVDWRADGSATANPCNGTVMYFNTEDTTFTTAKGAAITAVSGEGSVKYNGNAVSGYSLTLAYTNTAVVPSIFRFAYPASAGNVGDTLSIEGIFTDGTSYIEFEPATFRYEGISVNNKGWWSLVKEGDDSVPTTPSGAIQINYRSEGGETSGDCSNGTVYFTTADTGFNTNGNLTAVSGEGEILYNGNAVTGYSFTRPVSGLYRLNYAAATTVGDTLTVKGTFTDGTKQISFVETTFQYMGLHAATLHGYWKLISGGVIEEEIKVFPEITLSDLGIAEGTYGDESVTAVGSYTEEGGLFNKKFGMQLVRKSETSDTSAMLLYYGYKNDYGSAYLVQLRANNSIVVFNMNTALPTVTNKWTAIYLDSDCGVEFGSLYKLELLCEVVDADNDGNENDTVLRIFVNGVEIKGDNPAAMYVVGGADNLGNNVHFYGHAKNTMTVWNTDSEVVVDRIQIEQTESILSIAGTGTVRKEDMEGVVIDKATVEEIRLEAGVTEIASKCFDGFSNLKTVYYGNTIQTIAEDAFVNCATGVILRCVKGSEFAGGLAEAEVHPYYSFKMVTIGSSFGEDVNTYIWRLAKNYYKNLPGRAAGDSDYDEVVVAELYTGGGTLAQRVNAILGNVSTTCYYEKWYQDGTIEINSTPSGQLTAGWMRRALQDEYWDYVMVMQSAADSPVAESFEASTAGNGKADIDVVLDFVRTNNKNISSKYLWLMTWSYNYKLVSDYDTAVAKEKSERQGIMNSMQTAVQKRVDAGVLDGIVPAGASIDYLKDSFLGDKDANYTFGLEGSTGTYNGGNYSIYFALQRDIAHASAGLGRFVLGLTAFSYIGELDNMEVLTLSKEVYPTCIEEYEISDKAHIEKSTTKCYLEYDSYTEGMADMAASAAIQAVRNPYKDKGLFSVDGDVDGDGTLSIKDVMRYENVLAQKKGYALLNETEKDVKEMLIK